jgi:hypothetical protein
LERRISGALAPEDEVEVIVGYASDMNDWNYYC